MSKTSCDPSLPICPSVLLLRLERSIPQMSLQVFCRFQRRNWRDPTTCCDWAACCACHIPLWLWGLCCPQPCCWQDHTKWYISKYNCQEQIGSASSINQIRHHSCLAAPARCAQPAFLSPPSTNTKSTYLCMCAYLILLALSMSSRSGHETNDI